VQKLSLLSNSVFFSAKKSLNKVQQKERRPLSFSKRFCNLAWFLHEVCGEEERNLILHTLLPAMASLALSLPHNKPFLGEQYVPHTAEETPPR
jgi:hypothetical protein